MIKILFLVGEIMSQIITSSHKKLEIDEIIKRLYDIAILPKTKNIINNLIVFNQIDELRKELDNVDEAYQIIMRHERAPILIESDYDNILKIAKKGGKLTSNEIYETARLFFTIKANKKLLLQLQNEKINCHNYQDLMDKLFVIDDLFNLIVKSIDENGYVLDTASSTLKQIRNKLATIDQRIKAKCQEILGREIDKLSQNSIVMRNDCYCLAVKSEYKNMIKGTIQDYSSSMQTVYIEPDAVAILNREKSILYHEEHEEIERILINISKEIQNNVQELSFYFRIIVKIDLLFSKAVLALSYDGSKPQVNDDGILDLVDARHPLLRVAKVIPNNIKFDQMYDGIIITGPNTGGKTVMLKTVGLLVLMTKYGLLVPASSKSNIMIYDDVYCDIGDDQSIENNLSTFSSHMNNIVQIIDSVTPKSLVLFDEIGAGTDPIEGSNLAKSILKYLLNHNVSFITTTHYSELKSFGYEEPRIINASMEFDQSTLSPTYHLLIGVTGSSNALKIASRLGLKQEIIDDAENLMITSDTDVRKLIQKLEQLVIDNELQKLELEKLKKENHVLNDRLNNELANIEQTRLDIIKKAESKALKIVEDAKNEGDQLIASMQEKLNKNLKLHEVIELKRKLDELEVKKTNTKKPHIEDTSIKIKVGDDVYLPGYDQYGIVNKITNKGTYQISIGNLKLDCERSEIKKIKSEESLTPRPTSVSFASPKPKVSLVLDLRGERYTDAKDKLDKYIDDLVCAGIKQATIIHGFGTGTIRELVQSYIRKSPHIASFRYGGDGEGGLGVTVITLK